MDALENIYGSVLFLHAGSIYYMHSSVPRLCFVCVCVIPLWSFLRFYGYIIPHCTALS